MSSKPDCFVNVQDFAQTWQNELCVNSDEDTWDVIRDHTKKISLCNSDKLSGFKIPHHLQISSNK